MRFELISSPFSSVLSLDSSSLISFLDPRLREFAGQYRSSRSSPVPPCAFVLADPTSSFINGFAYPTAGAFFHQVKHERTTLSATLVVLLTELSSVLAVNERSLLAVEIQSPNLSTIRVALDLTSPLTFPVAEDWSSVLLDDGEESALLGTSLAFAPVF